MTRTANSTANSIPIICHRDGSVTVWDVYTQSWQRGTSLSDRVSASLTAGQRARITRHLARHGGRW